MDLTAKNPSVQSRASVDMRPETTTVNTTDFDDRPFPRDQRQGFSPLNLQAVPFARKLEPYAHTSSIPCRLRQRTAARTTADPRLLPLPCHFRQHDRVHSRG